jgi:hypothetical protein
MTMARHKLPVASRQWIVGNGMGGSDVYILTLSEIPKFDLADAPKFVEFWNQFYGYEATLADNGKQRIDYFSELNIGNELDEQNIRRLLRWKDPRFLTDPKKGTSQPNEKVQRVIEILPLINGFRNGQKNESEMKAVAETIFESPTIVWRVFLLHIAKPHLYPIADQNVFRLYFLHASRPEPQNWKDYAAYSNYFEQIADRLQITRSIENVRQLKKIDNALFVFGQFLASYYKSQPLAAGY